MASEAEPASTFDAFFGGRIVVQQPARGHRAGTDAVLLAAAVPEDFAGLVYDAGAGVGTAGLGVAVRCGAARVGLIELDPLSARLAEDNVAANGLAGQVAVHRCDLLRAAPLEKADLLITNPPFYEPGAVRASPDARRELAHVGAAGGTSAWIAACLALLKPRATMVILHRAEALPVLLRALERRAGALTLLPIHTKDASPAKRILVRAVLGSRAPLTLLPGLVLNAASGVPPTVARITRGETALRW